MVITTDSDPEFLEIHREKADNSYDNHLPTVCQGPVLKCRWQIIFTSSPPSLIFPALFICSFIFYVGKLDTQWCHSCLWFCLPKSPRPSGPPGASHPPTPNSAQHPGEASQARDAAWGAETWTVCPGKECTRLPINRHTWDRPRCRMSTGREQQQYHVPQRPTYSTDTIPWIWPSDMCVSWTVLEYDGIDALTITHPYTITWVIKWHFWLTITYLLELNQYIEL